MYHKGDHFRNCKKCGAKFPVDPDHPSRRRCPSCIAEEEVEKGMTEAKMREHLLCEKIAAEKMRERISKRDAAYARWERENGVAPTFEDRGSSVVENRGRVVIGVHAVNSVKHT